MKTLLLLFAIAIAAWGQSNSTKVAPDCTLGSIVFTGTGNSGTFDNRPVSTSSGIPCTLWTLDYSAQPSVTSLTINIQGAPDSNGVPGTFATLASSSTFASGKINWQSSSSYSPWMRVNISAVGAGGAINAVLNGWRDDQASIGGGGGGSACPGTIGTPCVIAGNGNGSASTVVVGPSHTAETISASTDKVLVTGTVGKTTFLTFLALAWDNAATITILQGTTSSTPCDTSTATIDGPYGNANLTALFNDYGADYSPLKTTATGLDICAHFSTSVTGGGGTSWSQF